MRTSSWAQVPSNFSREERQTWKRWLDNPDSTTPHKDIGSRSRPISIGASGEFSTDDELFHLMVKRGLVAAHPEEAGKSRLAERFWGNVKRGPGCWTWQAARRGQYGRMHLGNRSWIGAHRMAWRLSRGPIPDGMCVCHHCDNTLCVNPDHLFLGTNAENTADRTRKGRSARNSNPQPGTLNGRAKLTEDDVIDIRTVYAIGARQIDIAAAYGVTQVQISAIVRRKQWNHLP